MEVIGQLHVLTVLPSRKKPLVFFGQQPECALEPVWTQQKGEKPRQESNPNSYIMQSFA
jgi:hypothetical protein